MEIIKCSIAILFLIFLFYRNGILIKKILKSNKNDLSTTILYGFFTTIAIFETIAIPFNIFNLNVNILFYIELTVWIFIILLSFIIKPKDHKYKANIKGKIEEFKNKNVIEKISIVIFVILIVFQITNSMYLQRSDADDSFYISWSQQAKNLEQYMNTEPSTGHVNSIFPKLYIINSWEIFNGFIGRIFNVSIPALLHTFYPVLIISMAYMSYLLLIKKITNNKNPYLMAILFAILILYDGASARFRGSLLLGRCHQGKAIILNIIITFVFYKLLDYKNLNKEDILVLAFLNLTAIALNPIAIWLLPIIYFLFAIYILLHKDIKNIFKLVTILIPNFITLPIFVIFSLMASEGGATAGNILSYKQIVENFIRDGYLYILLYAISCIVTLIKGNKKSKTLIVFIPIIAFATVLNPFISKYIQKYVTSATTYWRLFWIIPMEIGISYSVYIICENINNKKMKYICAFIGIIVITFCGRYMFKPSCLFYEHENIEKISTNIINQTKFIEENSIDKVLVVAPQEPQHGSNMRQLTSKIKLFYSRPLYLNSMDNCEQRHRTFNGLYIGKDVEVVYNMFEVWNVDFIILDKDDDILSNIDYKIAPICYEDDKNVILYNVNSNKINLK